MAVMIDSSVNPYAITDLERLPRRLLSEGQQIAGEMANRGSGYGAIEQTLRRHGIGARAAQELAAAAISQRGMRLKLLGLLRGIAGGGLLILAWCLIQIVWPRIAIACAMFGMFLFMTGCSLVIHAIPQRRFGRATGRED